MGQGPLSGLRIVEFAGMGPAPFCGMLLSDLGADVIRIDRKGAPPMGRAAVLGRGRRSVALDLKSPAAAEACLKLFEAADGLIEGFRPGVMERLGLGPEVALSRNPGLVYGRMTGWGQTGPNASLAGHDINYIAISGALSALGSRERPIPPLNLLGDFGGGALYLAFGLLAAVLHARATGQGQVVDCAMTEGVASLMTAIYGLAADGQWTEAREANFLDGGAHFYATYQCADGKWVAVGALEPQFYTLLMDKAGITDPDLREVEREDPARWPILKARLAEVFAARPQAEWCALLEGYDTCFSPVLSMAEAPSHPHNAARGTFVEAAGVVQPAPAPRFSVTPGAIQGPPPTAGAHNREALTDWGFSARDIAVLNAAGALD